MRYLQLFMLIPVLAALGCPAANKSTPPVTTTATTPAKGSVTSPDTAEESEAALAEPAAGSVKITPANAKIEFVGTKTEGKHDGGFKKFLGGIELADNTVAKIKVEIDTNSLYSDNPKLTGHLKSPDFFDVKTHPKASFASTSIKAEAGKDTTHVITGELDLHGVKKSVSIPAKVDVTAESVAIDGAFKINRSDFGMTKLQGKVDDPATIKIAVKAARK